MSEKCWNCDSKTEKKDFFCSSCGKIQPPLQVDYFTIFGIPKSFEVAIKSLESGYFALQTKLHPDRFTGKSEKEKAFSMGQSMLVNTAYETLSDNVARAEYMLKLEGINIFGDNANVKPSPEILMENMELREQLAEAEGEQKRAIVLKIADEKISCIEDIKKAFENNDLQAAAQGTIRLKYLVKLLSSGS